MNKKEKLTPGILINIFSILVFGYGFLFLNEGSKKIKKQKKEDIELKDLLKSFYEDKKQNSDTLKIDNFNIVVSKIIKNNRER